MHTPFSFISASFCPLLPLLLVILYLLLDLRKERNMSEQVSMLVQEYSDDHLYQLLPETYRLSREVEEIKKIWQPLLEQELGPSINQIRDGTRTLFEGRSRLKGIVSRVERDERAQTVLQDFVKGKLPLPELRQLLQQLKEPVTPPPHPASSNEVRGRLNMAPPDNQSAVAIGTNGAPQTGASFVPDSFMTPRRPENGHSAVDSAARPSTVGRQDADTPTRQRGSISMALSPPNTVTTGVKRSLNTALAGDDHQSPESPSTSMSALNKRQRIALSGANRTPVRPPNTGSSAVTEVTRAVTFAEVCEEEFIFTDARCGPGWYVIRCNTNSRGFDNAPARFQRHPFDNDLALRHFNSKEVDCHDSRGKYTVEDIIRECAYRGK